MSTKTDTQLENVVRLINEVCVDMERAIREVRIMLPPNSQGYVLLLTVETEIFWACLNAFDDIYEAATK